MSELFRAKQGDQQVAEQEDADDHEGNGFHGCSRSLAEALATAKIKDCDGEKRHRRQSKQDIGQETLLAKEAGLGLPVAIFEANSGQLDAYWRARRRAIAREG
jgi:hypothetical protein